MIDPEEIGLDERVYYRVPYEDGSIDLMDLSRADAQRLEARAALEKTSPGELLAKIYIRGPREPLLPDDVPSFVRDQIQIRRVKFPIQNPGEGR
jgi:hypothetical protein